jgi:5'-deoxynucleotidase YfbR-like HD superfamily hydrolase
MTNEIETIFDNLDEYSDCINVLVEKLKQCGINSYDEFIETARELEYGPVKKSMREQIKEHFDTPFVRGAAADVDEDNDW